MEKFVETEMFKKLNIGFSLDEGLASINDVYSVYYAERCVWCKCFDLYIKNFWYLGFKIICTGDPGHGSRFIENTAGPKLVRFL